MARARHIGSTDKSQDPPAAPAVAAAATAGGGDNTAASNAANSNAPAAEPISKGSTALTATKIEEDSSPTILATSNPATSATPAPAQAALAGALTRPQTTARPVPTSTQASPPAPIAATTQPSSKPPRNVVSHTPIAPRPIAPAQPRTRLPTLAARPPPPFEIGSARRPSRIRDAPGVVLDPQPAAPFYPHNPAPPHPVYGHLPAHQGTYGPPPVSQQPSASGPNSNPPIAPVPHSITPNASGPSSNPPIAPAPHLITPNASNKAPPVAIPRLPTAGPTSGAVQLAPTGQYRREQQRPSGAYSHPIPLNPDQAAAIQASTEALAVPGSRKGGLSLRRTVTMKERKRVLTFLETTRVYVGPHDTRQARVRNGQQWEWDPEKRLWWRPPSCDEAADKFRIKKATLTRWWRKKEEIMKAKGHERKLARKNLKVKKKRKKAILVRTVRRTGEQVVIDREEGEAPSDLVEDFYSLPLAPRKQRRGRDQNGASGSGADVDMDSDNDDGSEDDDADEDEDMADDDEDDTSADEDEELAAFEAALRHANRQDDGNEEEVESEEE